MSEFMATLRAEWLRPISRAEQIAQDLETYFGTHQVVTPDDWLAFAEHMIMCVHVTRDLTAADIERALDSPLAFPLPDFDDL